MNRLYTRDDIWNAVKPFVRGYSEDHSFREGGSGTPFSAELERVLKENNLDIVPDDVIAFDSSFIDDECIIFTQKYVFINMGKGKGRIYYSEISHASTDEDDLVLKYKDGSSVAVKYLSGLQMEHIKQILCTVAAAAPKVLNIPKGMITHRYVDFAFHKYTDKDNLPDDTDALRRMCEGYDKMDTKDPRRLKSEDMHYVRLACYTREDTFSRPEAALDFATGKLYSEAVSKRNRRNPDYYRFSSPSSDNQYIYDALESGDIDRIRSKALCQLADKFENATSIISLIWGELIKDYLYSEYGGTRYGKNTWFFDVMDTLGRRMAREIAQDRNPVAYTVYSFFNTDPIYLEDSPYAEYEGKSVFELLGNTPSVKAISELFHIPPFYYYRNMSKYCPVARVISFYYNDVGHYRKKSGHIVDYGYFDDMDKRDKEQLSFELLMLKRGAEYGKLGQPGYDNFSHLQKVVDDAYYEETTLEYATSSLIDLIDCYKTDIAHVPFFYNSGKRLNSSQRTIAEFYKNMSDHGHHVFTCLLCEMGERIPSYVPESMLERRRQGYDELREMLKKTFL